MFRGGIKRSASTANGKTTPEGGASGSPSTTTVSTGTSTKGKTWRGIKSSGSGGSGNGSKKTSSKSSQSESTSNPKAPATDDEGGFLPLKTHHQDSSSSPPQDETTQQKDEVVTEASGSSEPQQKQQESEERPTSPGPIEDMLVPQPISPPSKPKSQPETTTSKRRLAMRTTIPAFPAFPALVPIHSRPNSSSSSSKKTNENRKSSEPALNVYLNHRQMVSQSKFRQEEEQQLQQEAAEQAAGGKMSRYQKLARDTKNLVARLSGDIVNPEKIRQVLKKMEPSSGKDESVLMDVTHPEFSCDEQTAAILLAELEGRSLEPSKEKSIHTPPPPRPPASLMQSRDCYSSGSSPEPVVKAQRFAQLRSLYRSLERLNELERATVSTTELNRLSTSDGVIDFDLWRRLRQHEKALEEMRHLATWIRAAQREGECYFTTTESGRRFALVDDAYRVDPGLRIKDQSVRHLTDKFKTIQQQYSTQSLPRNFATTPSPPPMTGRVSRSSQRRSSLSGQQVAHLKSQLARVYSPPTVRAATTTSDRSTGPARTKLYVRSASESSRDATLARLEERRSRILQTQKALSIASGGNSRPVQRSQSAVSESERRNLSARLSAEIRQRHLAQQQGQSSTRTAIQYVQQLSRKFQQQPSPPPPPTTDPRTRSSSRESSASSTGQQDYLLVLTPRSRNKAEVESVVQEWAESHNIPAVPKRSSSLSGRAMLDNDADSNDSSGGSSVQTVIQRDVRRKVDFFEKVIAGEDPNDSTVEVVPFRSSAAHGSRSVSDLRRSASTIIRRHPSSTLQRSATGPRRAHSLSVRSSMNDLRLHRMLERSYGRRTPPGGGASADRSYLNLVRRGDVVKKCQYFDSVPVSRSPSTSPIRRLPGGSIGSRSMPDSLPLWSAADVFGSRNKTVIKGQEVGDVSFMKRRYEPPRRPLSTRASTPTLSPSGHGWSRRLLAAAAAAAAAKKQVSFPSAGSSNGSTGSGKKLDFTRVKPTLLSSARLALIRQQTATTKSDLSPLSSNRPKTTTASPTMSHRSASQGSICSRRSASSPQLQTTTVPAATAAAAPQQPPKQTEDAPTTSKATGAVTKFDPSLHQPTYRYTPPPPSATVADRSVYDLYATYPRCRSSATSPNRPPLPANWVPKRQGFFITAQKIAHQQNMAQRTKYFGSFL